MSNLPRVIHGPLEALADMRVSIFLLRFQAYLDGAIDGYKTFWHLRMSIPTHEAVTLLTRTVVRTKFYMPMISCAYLVSILPPVLFLLIYLFNINEDMTSFMIPLIIFLSLPFKMFHPGNISMGDTALFFACCFVAAFVDFPSLLFSTEALFASVGVLEVGRTVKVLVSNRASVNGG